MPARNGVGAVARYVSAVVLVIAVAVWSRSGLAQEPTVFVPVGPLVTPIASAGAAPLPDGRLLVLGGEGAAPAEVYDPVSQQFFPTGALAEPRVEPAVVALQDGQVLIVGGRNSATPMATAELYDPATGTFTPTGSLSVARGRPAAVRLADGRVLVAGGHDGTAAHASAELYDPKAGQFHSTGSLVSPQLGSAALLPDGTVLIVGESTAEVYDPRSELFREVAALNIPRRGHAATALPDGRVLVTGGVDAAQLPVAEAELFDIALGMFQPAARMLTPRFNHAAVPMPNGDVFVIGGSNADGVLSSTELYNSAQDSFSAEATLLEVRSMPVAAVLQDGGVLVAGGRGAWGDGLLTAELYKRDDKPKATSTSLVASQSSSMYGQPITYTAIVGSNHGMPSGTVEFVGVGDVLGTATLDVDAGDVLGTATLDARGRAALTTTRTPAGLRSIVAIYHGSPDFRRSESPSISQTVAKATATGSLSITPIQRQYSDPVTFVATVSPGAAAQRVAFKLGATVLGVAAVVAGKATFETPVLPNMPPGSRIITAVFEQDVPNYTIASIAKSMSIVKEDARISSYNVVAYTPCGTCNIAKVLLKAEVRDISATPEANGDVTPGDIRNARVTFTNRTTYATIATVPVTLEDPNNLTIGEAVYEWTVDLGAAASKSFNIGYSVSGLYSRTTYDYVTVTVSKPK